MISMCSGCGSLGSERPNASANWGPSTDHGTRSGGRKVWSRRQSRSIVGVVIGDLGSGQRERQAPALAAEPALGRVRLFIGRASAGKRAAEEPIPVLRLLR